MPSSSATAEIPIDITGIGVFRKEDAAACVVKLACDPIPAVQRPAMTRDFALANPSPAARLQPANTDRLR